MNRLFLAGVGVAVLAALSPAQQTSSSANNGNNSPFVQVKHIVGDQYSGFRQSCLLVYADGRYHRETRRQENADGRPQGDWRLPEVFEGGIEVGNLQRLQEIVESENFRAISGTIGDPSIFSSIFNFDRFGVTPRTDVDIFEASLTRSNGSQVFAVVQGKNSRKLENSLKLFVGWVGEIEKRNEGRLDKALANDCATSPGTGSPWKPTTHLTPEPVDTPNPDYSLDERNATPSGTVLVQAIVNVDGSVVPISVRHGIDSVRDREALDAVRKWKFIPARLNGIPIPMSIEVEIHFGSTAHKS